MNIGGVGGEVPHEVALLAEELSQAVELTHLPNVTQEQRAQAYNACESFKEHSPWCAQAGFLLANGNYSPVVKHFGLKLIEHTVQSRWPHITQAEKIFIKENAMKLLYMGGWETGHLNNGLARVIVEMIKREWPQHWPTLLSELNDACSRGHMQTEIVLHIFLRLTEDVATLQTLEQQQRRKDIYQALTSNMAEIFAFFMGLIEMHVKEFREKTAAGDYGGAASNGRVVQAVLRTLTEFVEWVSTSHIVMNNGYLLQILCVLLQDDVFQLPAAECLLQIVNRKGSTKERKPLTLLFSEAALTCIRDATRAAVAATGDTHYLFLKKLAQVVPGLAALWVAVCGAEGGGALALCVGAALALAAHPALGVARGAAQAWLAWLRHERAAAHPHVLAALPDYLHCMAPKLLRGGYLGPRHDSLSHACADFDSEQEFNVFFNRCRAEILDTFRYCMSAAPLVTWAFVERWAGAALDAAAGAGGALEPTHPVLVQCEALAQLLDVVLSRLVQVEPRPDAAGGLRLLRRLVALRPPCPLLQSLLLSHVSALFVFLSCAHSQLAGPALAAEGAELLPAVLDKIFAVLEPDYDRADRNVKNLRRHAAGLLVKLASKYPLLLLPLFDRLAERVRGVARRPDTGAVESVTLQEALLLVSNHFCCYERQSALVGEVLGGAGEAWAQVRAGGAAQLARLLGLGQPAARADEARDARRRLHHALAVTLGVVKRCQVPADPERAARGGFAGGLTPGGHPVWRNPCAVHVLPLLPAVLALGAALHELHAPAAHALLHADYARVLAPPAAERRSLLGGGEAGAAPGAAERLQAYVHGLHESVCLVLGAAAASLGRELYAVPALAEYVAGTLLAQPLLPDHWLRPLVRNALRPLILHCPPAHYRDVAVPLLSHVAPFMVTHLARRWEYVASLYEAGKLEEESGGESQEVLEDILVRNLTREYLDLLKAALVEGAGGADDAMDEEGGAARAADAPSELGALVLAAPGGAAVLRALLLALTCADSWSSLRAAGLTRAAVRGALAAGRLAPADAAAALGCTLQALRVHGQHDANLAALLALGVHVYETLRPHFPAVGGVLRAIPDADPHDLQRLDDRLAAQALRPNRLDKTKRDLFKKVTSPLIGRDVGQLFKNEVFILNLPSMAAPRARAPGVLEAGEAAGLDRLFTPT